MYEYEITVMVEGRELFKVPRILGQANFARVYGSLRSTYQGFDSKLEVRERCIREMHEPMLKDQLDKILREHSIPADSDLWKPIQTHVDWLKIKDMGDPFEVCGFDEARRLYEKHNEARRLRGEEEKPCPGSFDCRQEGRPVRDVIAELNDRLKLIGVEPQEYGWSGDCTVLADDPGQKFPDHYRWIACFPVTGGSEGYYMHLEVFTQGIGIGGKVEGVQHIALAKTWTWDNACAVCNATAKLLGA